MEQPVIEAGTAPSSHARQAVAPQPDEVLALRGVTKRFGGAVALDGVDFDLHAGEIHGLLGENGAGKSTLIKVLAGVVQSDKGSIVLDGRPASFASPAAANEAGIACIFQELSLLPDLTVADNIAITRPPKRFGLIDTAAQRRLGGLLLQAPRMGWILGFCVMASLGLPGLAGFWGEFPAILSAYNPGGGLPEETFRTYMVIAAIGTVFAAGYLLWLYQRTSFGTPSPEFVGNGHDAHGHGHGDEPGHDDGHGHDLHDVNTFEWISWTPLLVAIVLFGVVPSLMFDVLDPAVQGLVESLSGK